MRRRVKTPHTPNMSTDPYTKVRGTVFGPVEGSPIDHPYERFVLMFSLQESIRRTLSVE